MESTPALPAWEQASLQMLASGNPGLQGVLERVRERQRRSLEWHARAQAALSGAPSQLPYESPLLPLCVARARGALIEDVDGNEYVDAHMGYTAGLLGHNPAPVLEAVRAALERGLGGGHFFEEQVRLAERVQAMVPGVERVAYFHTGGEAVAAAVRMARAATARPRVAKFEGCYHGSNDVGLHNTWMILSGGPGMGPIDGIFPQVATAGRRTDESFLILPWGRPEALELLRRHAADLACVVLDPAPPFMSNWLDDCRSFVRELAATARDVDVPLVLDEVVCGFRLARGGAREWAGIEPQLSCFGKITSGLGIPLSIVAGEAAFLDAARTDGLFRDYTAGKVWLSSTLQASFPAVAAALAQLEHLDADYDGHMGRLDAAHAALTERLAEVSRSLGLEVSLQGSPRLQVQLAVGKPEPPERSYRGMMQATSPALMRSLLALTFYLRLHGVYAKTVPTMNLSAAHAATETSRLADAIRVSLEEMRGHGLLAG